MLADQMASEGAWLFRRRSYVPLVLLPLVMVALSRYFYPDGSHAVDIATEMVLLALAFGGLGLRVFTVGFVPKGTSGRNTRQIRAEALNTTGMYSVVRHPLYLANYVIFAAVILHLNAPWLVLLGSALYWLYYERIMLAEERLLLERYGEEYRRWADRTSPIFPRPSRWRTPALTFSWRNALRREYPTFFLIIVLFTATEIIGDYVVLGRFEFDPLWQAIFFSGTAIYLVLRTVKKRTCWLTHAGR